jgi:transposase
VNWDWRETGDITTYVDISDRATPSELSCEESEEEALRRENLRLRTERGYYRSMHRKAVERARELEEENTQLKAKIRLLEKQLRERKTSRRGSERNKPKVGEGEGRRRKRGQQPGAEGHGRRDHSYLPVRVEEYDLKESQKRCPRCGRYYREFPGTEEAQILEIEVRAHRRLIRRKRYTRSCTCQGQPGLITACAPPRLIPKGILGVSIWVTVLIDKYMLYRPTYRLLEDFRSRGLSIAQGTVTDGLKRLGPLFSPLYEALVTHSRRARHWHADETRWMVFATTEGKAGYRWCLWVFRSCDTVVFKIDPTRSSRVPKKHFAGVEAGILSADRYSAYKRLCKETPLCTAFCWAHVRRDFIVVAEDWRNQRPWSDEWLAAIANLSVVPRSIQPDRGRRTAR